MTMKGTIRCAALGILILALVPPSCALGQLPQPSSPPPADAPAAPTFRREELEQLLAPIALYPDALLAQVLMAATYPLEVVQATRWIQANPNLAGAQLEAAIQQQPWDPSVKSLAVFPQVLAMMDTNLGWTQKLGDAFLAQQPDVMGTIQSLRAKAQAAGYLQSTPQHTVVAEPPAIRIEPAVPQIVYVPIYDPTIVYGPWWAPTYPPYYWYPPGYVIGASGISFGVGLTAGTFLWGGFDWHRHNVVIVNVRHYNTFNRTTFRNPIWRHDVVHRRNVPYHDPGVRERFGQGPLSGTGAREPFRGRAQEAPQQPGSRSVTPRQGGGSAVRVGKSPQGGRAASQVPRAPRLPAAFEGLGEVARPAASVTAGARAA